MYVAVYYGGRAAGVPRPHTYICTWGGFTAPVFLFDQYVVLPAIITFGVVRFGFSAGAVYVGSANVTIGGSTTFTNNTAGSTGGRENYRHTHICILVQ